MKYKLPAESNHQLSLKFTQIEILLLLLLLFPNYVTNRFRLENNKNRIECLFNLFFFLENGKLMEINKNITNY